MPSPREAAPSRKRLRIEAEQTFTSHSGPSKRLRSETLLHSAAFYDSLSKVWLTRRALKEHNRRTGQAKTQALRSIASDQKHLQSATGLKRFARQGGPELDDLRGFPAPSNFLAAMSTSPSSRSLQSKRTKSTAPSSASSKSRRSSAYDNDFEQHLNDHGIYMNHRKSKAKDLHHLHQRLAQPRASLSPSQFSDGAFENFQQKNEEIIEENEVMRNILPTICGNSPVFSKQNLLFTRLDPIANDTTVDAKPDLYDGARLGDVDPIVRRDLGHYIIPTKHPTAPVTPNFFFEAKAPSGGADVAKRQACYNGALGARAMHSLQSYKQEPVYDGNAYTISSTYHAGNLRLYATHVTSDLGGSPEYHMSQIDGWDTIGNPNTCRQAFTAFRNARDWAQENRDALISTANARARSALEPSHLQSLPEVDSAALTDASQASYSQIDADDQYYMSQPQIDTSSSAAPWVGSFSTVTDSQGVSLSPPTEGTEYFHQEPLASSAHQGELDLTAAYPAVESDTSVDDTVPAVDPLPASSNKRRHESPKSALTVARISEDKTRRKHPKR